MFKERDFHKLIEDRNLAEKHALWQKIETELNSESVNAENCGNVLAASKNRTFNFKVFAVLCAAFLLVIGLSVYFIVTAVNKNSVGGFVELPVLGERHCNIDDYDVIETEITIKQYNSEKNTNILYFDYYDHTAFCADFQYILKDGGEIICLYEQIRDANGAFITVNVTDCRTYIDNLDNYDNMFKDVTDVKSVSVELGVNSDVAYAKFVYEGHRYYLSVDRAEEDYILQLIQTLLT